MEQITRERLDLERASLLAETFKGLGDVTRLRLLSILMEGETCVSDLAEQTEISQSAVSHQLRVLRNLGFVSNRRDGKNIYYQIDDDHIEGLLQLALEHSYHLDIRE
ncbi:MAG: metalloregulator ArsR/SmtB family transcription factor [Anaerolineaceae bacterium]|jgi:DNA-binding transcriptional ArsR family regulator|nr:metalloregulator ArsR/SmtB family transcription factor [Anaerolineaceae bacterium]